METSHDWDRQPVVICSCEKIKNARFCNLVRFKSKNSLECLSQSPTRRRVSINTHIVNEALKPPKIHVLKKDEGYPLIRSDAFESLIRNSWLCALPHHKGIRGRMQCGFGYLNELTIIQIAQSTFKEEERRKVVVGFDGRHNSRRSRHCRTERYAHLVVNVLRNANVTVFLYSECVPTPLVAFGVRHLKCCCGVMITASHNPKQDNGFKLYWEYGAQETLTGFKWIGNTCNELNRQNNSVLFAYEEAIGYMCNPYIPDKDGISAAVLIAQLTGYLTAHQKNPFLSTLLERLYRKYGRHLTRNSYFVSPSPQTTLRVFDRLRNYDGPYPTFCGEFQVKNVRDLTTGFDNSYPDRKAVNCSAPS
ncbi:LOW QUALITY PROTEIN: phosphoglucomutase-2-like [Octopus sinensis]|uniref:LOW QUALITY PROTEIN: phosphoglucomutase-2-like n=1 Tax=Octopus sinensis TaxID=2607531 RepID=A0A7E6EH42_9MOLL|nr:LOW QUALITY PROTEIN: phosphoglucomutase-2-like [Octopus sinensis]